MVWYEIGFGTSLVAVLLALSIYFGRQQFQALRHLRLTPNLPSEELRYERRKAFRRLVSCSLTLIMAVLLGVHLMHALPVQEIADERDQLEPGVAHPIPEEQKPVLRVWGWTLITFLVLLMVVLMLAGIDLLSTRRFALRQYRKIQEDRRAMIQRQVNRMRRDRNGHD